MERVAIVTDGLNLEGVRVVTHLDDIRASTFRTGAKDMETPLTWAVCYEWKLTQAGAFRVTTRTLHPLCREECCSR
jgi:hypothetical protein